jgi:hypothetical protein
VYQRVSRVSSTKRIGPIKKHDCVVGEDSPPFLKAA